uniref:Uncharacterized protein n=1 Tax=Ananas comosus var. bracteatus TaxID=296719 RepID=A0A6V7QMM2_ANACO|nr:unnamed protein product [Ananas comosus var. bracteatus]
MASTTPPSPTRTTSTSSPTMRKPKRSLSLSLLLFLFSFLALSFLLFILCFDLRILCFFPNSSIPIPPPPPPPPLLNPKPPQSSHLYPRPAHGFAPAPNLRAKSSSSNPSAQSPLAPIPHQGHRIPSRVLPESPLLHDLALPADEFGPRSDSRCRPSSDRIKTPPCSSPPTAWTPRARPRARALRRRGAPRRRDVPQLPLPPRRHPRRALVRSPPPGLRRPRRRPPRPEPLQPPPPPPPLQIRRRLRRRRRARPPELRAPPERHRAQTLDPATGSWSRLNNAVMVFDKMHPSSTNSSRSSRRPSMGANGATMPVSRVEGGD